MFHLTYLEENKDTAFDLIYLDKPFLPLDGQHFTTALGNQLPLKCLQILVQNLLGMKL
jgi:hypothetical protein